MKLYVYDHCPYCVKARMIFGFKGVDFELVTLLNDDENTPISMIGQKLVPILEKKDGSFMGESMDIVSYIDNTFGERVLIGNSQNNQLIDWQSKIREVIYSLAMPRWVDAALDEFKTESARSYFTKKKEAYIGDFSEHISESGLYIEKANGYLEELEEIIKSESSVNGELREADIHLFADLRSLSIVKGIIYPSMVEKYRQKMSEKSGIPLHDDIAI